MNDPKAQIEAIRALLFEKAGTVNDRLIARFADVADHLRAGEHLAVIGAMEGTEADIQSIRTLMLLMRDLFELQQ